MIKHWKDNIGEHIFKSICLLAITLPLLTVAFFVINSVVIAGWDRLTLDFLSNYPSRHADKAGILPAIVGSIYIITLTTLIAVPIGVASAIYLEKYSKRGRLYSLIDVNIANLAGVPSVVYGLLGLGIFVRAIGFDRSIISGALTMALLILPIIIIVSKEAIKNVPNNLIEASYALGASKRKTIFGVILPLSVANICTGCILAVSRAIGEAAPLLMVGAFVYVPFLPSSPMSPFTTLPIQIFNWASRPQHAFAINAAAGIAVLLLVVFMLNGLAIFVRNKYQRRM